MLFDTFSHLVFCFYCSDSSEKINQMTYPHNRNADTSRRNSAHHNKSRTHYNGHGSYNAQLRSHCHGSLFHKAVQMFLIQPGSCKPVVKLSRAFRKAEHRRHIERHCRQNRQNDSQGAQSQTDKSQHNPEDPQRISLVHPSLTSFSLHPGGPAGGSGRNGISAFPGEAACPRLCTSYSQYEFFSFYFCYPKCDSVQFTDAFRRNNLIRSSLRCHMSVFQTDNPV